MSDIYLQITETPTVVTLSAPVVSGTLSSTVTVANTVTVALDSNSLSALENVTVTVGAAITGTVTISNFPASQAVTFSAVTISNFPATQAVSLASVPTHGVTLASTTVTVSSLPVISGTVTANLASVVTTDLYSVSSAVKVTGADGQGVLLGGLNISNNPENVYEGGAIPVRGQVGMDVPISGTVTVGNSVTISSLPVISGTVTVGAFSSVSVGSGALLAGGLRFGNVVGLALDGGTGYLQVKVESAPSISGTVTLGAGTAQIGSVTASISGTVPISISSVTVGNSVTIGSLPAISGTVTANLSISSTAITSGSFTSLTSATLVPSNTARKMATVYNLGAGQLFVNAGATATTLGGGFMVALSSGDFYECDYTTTTLSAIFATAGTASWVSH